MRWLRGDQGISVVLVGVLLAVLLALVGMSVDLGAVYAERRELRNGADAAALAIAEDCGRQARPCDQATAENTAQQYADRNSQDGASSVESVVLTLTGSTTGSVRVVTSAFDAAHDLPGVRVPLMSLLGLNRVTVRAAATAIFDHPRSGRGLPVIVGTCEFLEAGGYGSTHTITLFFHVPSSTDTGVPCPSDPANKDFPGGFGWLEPVDGACEAAATVGSWVPGNPGVPVPKPECTDPDALRTAIYDQDLMVPLYADVDGHDKTYLVAGWGAFHVTAYDLSGKYRWPKSFKCPSDPSPSHSTTCLQGYFTVDTIYTGEPGGGDYGVVLVKLTE